MALNRTCKANAFDELSLTMFIENEITRQYNGMDTMEEAIDFLRYVYGWSVFKEWLERDYESILVSIELLSIATRYEVMLAKMLQAVPTESERYKLLSEKDKQGRTLLHKVAQSGNPESIKTVLALYPESALECFEFERQEWMYSIVLCCHFKQCRVH